MDYRKHYDVLIERARNRIISGYVEIHHVVPRCMGGGDERSNLVQLTPEEHFVAHQLLCKVHPKVKGLAFALQLMTATDRHKNRARNKLYGWIRRRYSLAQRGRIKSLEERAHIAEAGRNRKPRIFSEQARINMAAARRKVWEIRRRKGEHLLIAAKTRATRMKNGSYNFTEEHKNNIGKAGIGRIPWNKGMCKELP